MLILIIDELLDELVLLPGVMPTKLIGRKLVMVVLELFIQELLAVLSVARQASVQF
jgi:hypothetical protein